jgi:hypothetical protein
MLQSIVENMKSTSEFHAFVVCLLALCDDDGDDDVLHFTVCF